ARRVHLRQSGQTWTDAVALVVSRNLIESDHSAVAAHVDFAGPQRPRSDETHVAAQDVDELRQFVHRRSAEHAADARNSWIVFCRLHWAAHQLRVRSHRPNFQRPEPAPAPADTILRKEDRTAVLELDGGGNEN